MLPQTLLPIWIQNSDRRLQVGLPDHFKFFQEHFGFQRDAVGYFHWRPREVPIGHFPPAIGLRTENL